MTITDQAKATRTMAPKRNVTDFPAFVRMTQGTGPVLLIVHPARGNVLCYHPLAKLVPEGVETLAFQSPGDGQPRSIGDLARTYAQEFSNIHRAGRPIYILGWSMGGVIAMELACLLEQRGIDVVSVTLLDSWFGGKPRLDRANLRSPQFLHGFLRDLLDGADPGIEPELMASSDAPLSFRDVIRLASRKHSQLREVSVEDMEELFAEYTANYAALLDHRSRIPRASLIHYVAARTEKLDLLKRCSIRALSAARRNRISLSTRYVDEDHYSIVRPVRIQCVLGTMFSLRQRGTSACKDG